MRWTALFALAVAVTAWPAAGQDDRRIELEIGEDTTFFTGPVKDDGTIDYIAALNAHYGEGIANEDNAFVAMFQLFPIESAPLEVQEQSYQDNLYRYFGMVWDPDYPRFTDWYRFAKERGIDDELAVEIHGIAMSRPWTTEEYPVLAEWLQANERAFGLLDQGLARREYHSPLIKVDENESVVSILLPHLTSIRRLGRNLLIRSYFEMGRGSFTSACEGLNLLHQMGCLVSREPTLIGKLVGVSIRAMPGEAVAFLVNDGLIDHDLAMLMLSSRSQVPTVRPMSDAIRYAERCMALDMIQFSFMGQDPGWAYLAGDANVGGDVMRIIDCMAPLAQHQLFDVNLSLVDFNEYYNQLCELAQLDSPADQQQAFAEFSSAVADRIGRDEIVVLIGMRDVDAQWLLEKTTWTVDRYTVGVTATYARFLFAAHYPSIRSQRRCSTRRLTESVAIALLGHRDQHGELPESLDALVPTYFDAVPMDPYAEGPLVYRVNEDGSALVYSIGDDFEDDGGVDDFREGDIAIRVGPPPVVE